ncbi:nucleotide sugar dehydrogenase [Candidatus Parcubacteria bacterium]|nr:MAG: nucleotide sugar dehydrogenase [Candidatus Parcubacteria bacterium]
MKICVVGLGYVGLPLACLLSKKFEVLGFDRSSKKIEQLKKGQDKTGEVENLSDFKINFSDDEKIIKEADFVIVAVPTPVLDNNEPDLSLVESATATVAGNLKKGAVVVYESTVYPGCTEEVCLPIFERQGLKYGRDFGLGYSPERVNPGDKEHTIDRIFKIVSGDSPETLKKVTEVYSAITKVYPVSSIKVAEAAKVIENIQRDLNIALSNELSLIFEKMGINTREVIEAAGTKWNYAKYYPGLVGGHCIAVDPYYLTYKAQKLGYEPKVILAGREINNYMSRHVTRQIVTMLTDAKKKVSGSKILILGVSFKENIPDTRNSRAKDIILGLKSLKAEVFACDPLVDEEEIKRQFLTGTKTLPTDDLFDAFVLFSPHKIFKDITLQDLKKMSRGIPVLHDLKGFYNKAEAGKLGFIYKTL